MSFKGVLKAAYKFEATKLDEEISLVEGDIIYLIYKDGSGWAKGKKKADAKIGWFPIEYTVEITDEPLPDETTPEIIPVRTEN
jgi:hypothetical protein